MKSSESYYQTAKEIDREKDVRIRKGNVLGTLAASARVSLETTKYWVAAALEKEDRVCTACRLTATPTIIIIGLGFNALDISLAIAERAKPGTADKVQPTVRRKLGI